MTKVMKKELLHFTKYARRQELARFMVQYELFKKVQNIKGSIVECGVHLGGGLLAWAKIAETLEPYNFLRKIFGFDTFSGFPSISKKDIFPDKSTNSENKKVARKGHLKPAHNTLAEMQMCIENFNSNRLLNHQEKIILVKGNAVATIPKFIKTNPHLLVSLLYLDFDLYEATKVAMKSFIPRMPKGSIIAFDELNDQKWPGETIALLESLNINNFKLQSFPFEPHISWIK